MELPYGEIVKIATNNRRIDDDFAGTIRPTTGKAIYD